MTATRKIQFDRWARPILAGTAFCLVAAQPAVAKTRATVVLTGGTSVETSPYQNAGSQPVGISVLVGVSPSVSIDSGTTKVRLFGNAELNQYIKDYGNDISGSIGVSATTQISSRTSIYGQSSFSSSARSYRDRLRNLPDPAVEPDPTIPVDTLLPDPSLIGTRVRSNSFSTSGGLSHVISAWDSINVGMGYSKGWTDNSIGGRDFQQYSGRVNYSRRLSSATSVSLGFSAARTNYAGGSLGDSTVLSPTLGVNTRLGGRWILSASGGVSLVRQNIAPAVTVSSTAFSGGLSLCSRDSRGGVCFSASRAVQPTFLGDSRSSTQFGASYSRRLNQNDNLSLSASYARTGDSLQTGLRGGALDTLGTSGRYTHRFSRRINGFAAISYDKVLRSAVSRNDNFSFNLGISYVLGDTQ